MTKEIKSEAILSRRKALGRLGLLAATAYTVPAFTTLSMAHASSGSSGSSDASDPSKASDPSDASAPSEASTPSDASSPSSSSSPTSATSPSSAARKACGNPLPGDAAYEQCLIDNGIV